MVAWDQADVHASKLAASAKTPSDAALRAIVRAAAARGLAVLLFPIVTLDKLAIGQWRGTIAPDDPDAWWSDYESMIAHYAQLAADEGVAALSVGSELGSTEDWRDRWFHLISRVQRVFPGALTYSANWDHFTAPSFWSRLDWIGVTGYFELTKDKSASAADLAAAWTTPRDQLLAFAKKADKPLVLTEIGYPSVDGGAVHPWDYTQAGAVDLEEQRRAFAALASAWGGSGLGGVFVWDWEAGGAHDRGYSPRGKPAGDLLSCWFHAH